MSTLSFALGIMLGALATFAFVFITMGVATHKKANKPDAKDWITEDLVMKLFDRYLKETKDDGK